MNTQQITYAKLFVWNPRTEKWNYVNGTGAAITIPIGTSMGIIFATSKTVPTDSTATNGSQCPYGILTQTTTIPANSNMDLSMVVSGDVVSTGIVFANGTDTLNTQVTVGSDVQGTMHTLMTKGGLRPVPSAEGTFGDN